MVGSVGRARGGVNASAWKQMQDELFKKIDRNGDGSITKDELSKVAPANGPSVNAVFKTVDSNGDGAISRAEFDAGAPQGRQAQGQGARPAGGPPPRPAGGGQKPAASDDDSTGSSLAYDVRDTNKDGVVSAQEQFTYNLTHPAAVATSQQATGNVVNANLVDVAA